MQKKSDNSWVLSSVCKCVSSIHYKCIQLSVINIQQTACYILDIFIFYQKYLQQIILLFLNMESFSNK